MTLFRFMGSPIAYFYHKFVWIYNLINIELCMFYHFRPLESIDVQPSAMQTHLHSKLLMIWILFGRVIIIIIKEALEWDS